MDTTKTVDISKLSEEVQKINFDIIMERNEHIQKIRNKEIQKQKNKQILIDKYHKKFDDIINELLKLNLNYTQFSFFRFVEYIEQLHIKTGIFSQDPNTRIEERKYLIILKKKYENMLCCHPCYNPFSTFCVPCCLVSTFFLVFTKQ